ncbi:MAG: STT3 domain-containing protein [Candidatus Pacearchaeota archaeon]
MNEEEKIIEERKKRLINFLKNGKFLIIFFLLIAIILGIYIRSLPMKDHNGKPGLWDITTNTWTLGPDLDPFLFLRYAKTIVNNNGYLPIHDEMRYVPLGFDTREETRLLPYMISWTYFFISKFKDINVEYAAVVFPVIMFFFTIIVFFFFVREIFLINKKDKKADIIALISTFFMIVIPVLLPRTIAGIPEKESAGFLFMFLSFFLFLRALRSNKGYSYIIFGILSGISTSIMGLIWGGVIYIFTTISIFIFISFILNKIEKKEFIVYSLWIIFSYMFLLIFSKKYSLKGLLTSLDSGLSFIIFFILCIHFILWKTPLEKKIREIKIPKNLFSLIISFILILIIIIIFFGFSFIIEKIDALNHILFNPITGRWSTTVAENRQPYFNEWANEFGPIIGKFPIIFWLFFIGSILLFYNVIGNLKKRDRNILTLFYIFFLIGLIFSRYSEDSIFNGTNFISKLFYYSSSLLLISFLLYYYTKYYKEKNNAFEKIKFNYIFLFSFFILCLFTARSAVRLIMTLAPVAVIFVAYLITETFDKVLNSKKDSKILYMLLFILIFYLSFFAFISFLKESKKQAYNYVPDSYRYQWQLAMKWVRENTSENAVFAHWWDYGYWTQSMGNRATVTDGGNAIVWWNYLTGRYVLTGNNEKEALEFLYNHNATYLLIDSTDIGKYGAFSKIGSDKNYDRFSYGPLIALADKKNIQETKNGTIIYYYLNGIVEDDINYQENNNKIFIPGVYSDSKDNIKFNAYIIGIILESIKSNNTIISFKQPIVIYYYQGKQYKIPLRYIFYKDEILDFKSGLEGGFVLIQEFYQTETGNIKMEEIGAGIYLSPRVMRTFFAQKYILNDPFNRFDNFELVHKEDDLLVSYLRQNSDIYVGDFIYYYGIRGPIKIWKINYNGDEKINETYLRTSQPPEITWNF